MLSREAFRSERRGDGPAALDRTGGLPGTGAAGNVACPPSESRQPPVARPAPPRQHRVRPCMACVCPRPIGPIRTPRPAHPGSRRVRLNGGHGQSLPLSRVVRSEGGGSGARRLMEAVRVEVVVVGCGRWRRRGAWEIRGRGWRGRARIGGGEYEARRGRAMDRRSGGASRGARERCVRLSRSTLGRPKAG